MACEDLSSIIMSSPSYDPLMSRSVDLEFGPGLAESWERLAHHRWRLTLRDGVTFTTGQALTATDVVFSMKMARASIRPNLVASIASATAIEGLTVEIKTAQPWIMPSDLTERLIMDADYMTATGDQDMDLKHIATGPDTLEQWIKEERLVLSAFAGDWAGTSGIEMVTFRPITIASLRKAHGRSRCGAGSGRARRRSGAQRKRLCDYHAAQPAEPGAWQGHVRAIADD